jgi:hypothetical protein
MNTKGIVRDRNAAPWAVAFSEASVCIKGDVVLGSPKSKCSGVGICRISASGSGKAYSCPVYSVEVIGCGGNQMKIIFEKEQLGPSILEKHFQGGFFCVEEDYIIARDMAEMLNMKKRWIRPGVYPVQQSAGHIMVIFTL